MDPCGPSSAPLVASAHLETELQAVQAMTTVATSSTTPVSTAPAAAPARMAQVQVAVPVGAEIGQEISFVPPGGEVMSVRSTQRLAPGSLLTVQYPLARELVGSQPPQVLAVQASAPPASAMQVQPSAPMEVELGEGRAEPPRSRCAGRGAMGTLMACGCLLLLLVAVGHRHLHRRHHWHHGHSGQPGGHHWHAHHRDSRPAQSSHGAGEGAFSQEYQYGYYASTWIEVNGSDYDQVHSGHAHHDHHHHHHQHGDHNKTRQSHREVQHGEFYYDYYSNSDSVVDSVPLDTIEEPMDSPFDVLQAMSGADDVDGHEVLA